MLMLLNSSTDNSEAFLIWEY